ncbi:hypothetical protein OAO55_03390, partial [Bacteroidales bacterium]|nr:hypothetical protein [Bacteroidales bacterium]
MKLNTLKYLLFYLLLTLFNTFILEAKQNINPFHTKGDYYYHRYEFKKSIVLYNRAFKKDSSDYLSLLKKGDAYSKLNSPIDAEKFYSIGIMNLDNVPSLYYLKYAITLLRNKKYSESKKWLNKYKQIVESDIRAQNYLSSIENKNQFYQDSVMFMIENTEFINSIQS